MRQPLLTHSSNEGTRKAKFGVTGAHYGSRIIKYKELEQTENRKHHALTVIQSRLI